MDGTRQPVVVAPVAPTPAPKSARSRKACVRLTAEQRARLEAIVRDGDTRRKRFVHARALLMADEDHPEGRYTDQQIGDALGVAAKTVARIRTAFLRGGITVAVERKARATPPVEPVIDGRAEATLVAICCSPAPAGRARWTMQLLADELVGRKVVAHVCKETVRKALKKTSCSPGA
jgi:hypothetical protein